ncbi:HNH endonuclease [Akkermansiaceae bacterium]|nr:HNH endonuclease [Akkermansiaceae bacterium]
MRNPPWTRDELILALDLYFRVPEARGNKSNTEVIALSELLNRLPIHGDKGAETTFRNANGVGMKLINFLPYDPDYDGKGLSSGGKADKEIWDEFFDHRERLSAIAQSIRENSLDPILPVVPDLSEDEAEASEGRLLTKIHRYRERDSKIVRKKKENVLQATGNLRCEACGFDYSDVYPQLGDGFCECHHDKPVSELRPGEKTKMKDLRVVCSNCHRMIHRKRPWKTVEEIQYLVRTSRGR